MKHIFSSRLLLVLCISMFASAVFTHRAKALTGLELEIGNSNDAGAGSAAIGSFNTVLGIDSLGVGYDNTVGGFFNAAFGSANTLESGQSVVIGNSNYLQATPNPPICSLVVGDFNFLSGRVNSNIISGFSNVVQSQNVGGNEIPVEASVTFGRGLINKWSFSLIAGQYNSTTPPATLLFAIGNGNDASNRRNAVEVYTDGKVVIRQAQGDILMGEFGN